MKLIDSAFDSTENCIHNLNCCPYLNCDAKFYRPYRLQAHIKAQHEKVRDYVCLQCEKAFYRREHLKRHTVRTHLDKGIKGNKFICDKCKQEFSLKQNYKKHLKQCLSPGTGFKQIRFGKHICNICGSLFKKRDLYQKHMFSHTGEKSLFCPHEGCFHHIPNNNSNTKGNEIKSRQVPGFITPAQLNRHLKIHEENVQTYNSVTKLFSCPFPPSRCPEWRKRVGNSHRKALLMLQSSESAVVNIKHKNNNDNDDDDGRTNNENNNHKVNNSRTNNCNHSNNDDANIINESDNNDDLITDNNILTNCVTFKSEKLLSQHIKLCHGALITCTICDRKFLTKRGLTRHCKQFEDVTQHLALAKRSKHLVSFKCPNTGCSKYYLHKRNLTQHLKQCQSPSPQIEN